MTNDEERARELLQSARFIRGEIAVEIVMTFINKIRAEAADRFRAGWRESFPGLGEEPPEWTIAAITGKEITK